MKKKEQFGEGTLYTIFDYIMWLFAGNFYFLLCNVPVLLFLFAFKAEWNILSEFILFVCALPIGPSYTALLSIMGKLVREKDLNVTKDYFKAYKNNFKQSFLLWSGESFLIFIFLQDIRFISTTHQNGIFLTLFYVLLIMTLLVNIYVYPIISRFYLKSKNILILSFIYAVRKFKITIINISTFILGGILLYKFPGISMFFVSSVVCYIVMYYSKGILEDIENKINEEK